MGQAYDSRDGKDQRRGSQHLVGILFTVGQSLDDQNDRAFHTADMNGFITGIQYQDLRIHRGCLLIVSVYISHSGVDSKIHIHNFNEVKLYCQQFLFACNSRTKVLKFIFFVIMSNWYDLVND